MEEKNFTNAVSNVSKGMIIKIALVVCLICFLLPFVTVSCGNMSMQVTGLEIATGIFGDEALSESEDIALNVFALISLITVVASLVFVFSKKQDYSRVRILSAVGCVALVLFWLTFKVYYGIEKEDEAMITVEYNFAMWAAIILQGVIAYMTKGAQEEISGAVTTAAKSTFCASCGSPVAAGDPFCGNCGAPVQAE